MRSLRNEWLAGGAALAAPCPCQPNLYPRDLGTGHRQRDCVGQSRKWLWWAGSSAHPSSEPKTWHRAPLRILIGGSWNFGTLITCGPGKKELRVWVGLLCFKGSLAEGKVFPSLVEGKGFPSIERTLAIFMVIVMEKRMASWVWGCI